VAIVIKLGGAPFHGWFFSLSKSIRLNTIFILSTLQKLIPIIILSNLNFYFYFLIRVSILRFLVILFNGINLISLIKVLALSRLNNLIWFFLSITAGIQFFFFFFVYLWLFLGLFFLFNSFSNRLSNQLKVSSLTSKLLSIFVFLSLGGLPPLLGFLRKVFILKYSILYINIFFLVLLVLSSLNILFIYTSYRFLTLRYFSNISLTSYGKNTKIINLFYFLSTLLFCPIIIL